MTAKVTAVAKTNSSRPEKPRGPDDSCPATQGHVTFPESHWPVALSPARLGAKS